jgi:hypothetical protein
MATKGEVQGNGYKRKRKPKKPGENSKKKRFYTHQKAS